MPLTHVLLPRLFDQPLSKVTCPAWLPQTRIASASSRQTTSSSPPLQLLAHLSKQDTSLSSGMAPTRLSAQLHPSILAQRAVPETPDPCSFPRARTLPRVRPCGNSLRRAIKTELEVLMPTVLRTAHGAQLWEVQCPCGNGNFAANPKTFPTPNKRMAAARAVAPSGKDQAKCVAACASKGAIGGDPNCEHRFCTTDFKLVMTVCDDLILSMLAVVHHDFRLCCCSHLRCNMFVANRMVHFRRNVTARPSPRLSLRTRPKPPKASRGTSQILVHGS